MNQTKGVPVFGANYNSQGKQAPKFGNRTSSKREEVVFPKQLSAQDTQHPKAKQLFAAKAAAYEASIIDVEASSSRDMNEDDPDELDTFPPDSTTPNPQLSAHWSAEGSEEAAAVLGDGSLAAQHPYYGYWSRHSFEEPERDGEMWCGPCPLCITIVKKKSRSGCIRHLNKHVKIIHDQMLDFKCPSCRFATGDMYALQTHVRTCRRRPDPIAQQHPYKGYWTRHPLDMPERVGGPNWTGRCPLCRASVNRLRRSDCIVQLNKHFKLVHDKVRDLKCPTCGYATGDHVAWLRHSKRCRTRRAAADAA